MIYYKKTMTYFHKKVKISEEVEEFVFDYKESNEDEVLINQEFVVDGGKMCDVEKALSLEIRKGL